MTPRRFAGLPLSTVLAAAVALPGLSLAQNAPSPPAGGNPAPAPTAPQNAAPPGGVSWRQPLNRGASTWMGQALPPGPAPEGGVWQPPYNAEYGTAEAHAAASNLSVIPGYGTAAAHAVATGLSAIPGSGTPEGPAAYQGNPGRQPGPSGSATSSPAPGLYGSARITSTSPSQSAPTEDTNRVLRLLKYASASGGLEWPLALRALPPGPAATQVREQIDQLVAEARRQSDSGQVKPALVEDLRREVKELRRLWDDRGEDLPLSAEAITAGRDFLRRLGRALE